ncbi:MAG: hypothetical protein WC939_01500 [Acholeplasmataceae bacterium]
MNVINRKLIITIWTNDIISNIIHYVFSNTIRTSPLITFGTFKVSFPISYSRQIIVTNIAFTIFWNMVTIMLLDTRSAVMFFAIIAEIIADITSSAK